MLSNLVNSIFAFCNLAKNTNMSRSPLEIRCASPISNLNVPFSSCGVIPFHVVGTV